MVSPDLEKPPDNVGLFFPSRVQLGRRVSGGKDCRFVDRQGRPGLENGFIRSFHWTGSEKGGDLLRMAQEMVQSWGQLVGVISSPSHT